MSTPALNFNVFLPNASETSTMTPTCPRPSSNQIQNTAASPSAKAGWLELQCHLQLPRALGENLSLSVPRFPASWSCSGCWSFLSLGFFIRKKKDSGTFALRLLSVQWGGTEHNAVPGRMEALDDVCCSCHCHRRRRHRNPVERQREAERPADSGLRMPLWSARQWVSRGSQSAGEGTGVDSVGISWARAKHTKHLAMHRSIARNKETPCVLHDFQKPCWTNVYKG